MLIAMCVVLVLIKATFFILTPTAFLLGRKGRYYSTHFTDDENEHSRSFAS